MYITPKVSKEAQLRNGDGGIKQEGRIPLTLPVIPMQIANYCLICS